MACGINIRTYYEERWHDGDVYIIRAADHGAWLGSQVFDGLRSVGGLIPDIEPHCQRLNDSAIAMGIAPTMTAPAMIEIIRDGIAFYDADAAVYIRPMYWAIDGDEMVIVPGHDRTGFSLCLEEIPMPPEDAALTLCRTRYHRPTLASAVVNAKAGCLYPNTARMLREARSRGFSNVIATDALGNIAETATSNLFMVRDGVVMTPVANGTFLAGITRARIIDLLRRDGHEVQETVLSFEDFTAADEVFSTGNLSKVMPVNRIEDTHYQTGPLTRRAREIYWEWSRQNP